MIPIIFLLKFFAPKSHAKSWMPGPETANPGNPLFQTYELKGGRYAVLSDTAVSPHTEPT